MAAVVSAIDGDANPGVLEIGTVGMAATLVSIALDDPSFTESAGTITLNGAPKSGVASNGGVAAVARFKNGAGEIIINNLTVGTIGCDIIVNSVNLQVGLPVVIQAASFTHG
jgi:hypothetical protein